MSPLCQLQMTPAGDFQQSISGAVRPMSGLSLMIKRKYVFSSYM
jgi:hypothetical protein